MWNKVVNLYYEVKYAFQRMFRGYGDDEVIDFDAHFIKRTIRILNDMHRNCDCYPADKVNSLSEWRWKLRSMQYYLARMEDDFYINEDGEYELSEEELNEELELSKQRFFSLFNEYFYNLWI